MRPQNGSSVDPASSGTNIGGVGSSPLPLPYPDWFSPFMRILDKRLLEQLSAELAVLCSDMLELEASLLNRPWSFMKRIAGVLEISLTILRCAVTTSVNCNPSSLFSDSPHSAERRVMSSMRCRPCTAC